jgi:hypothetical protein
MPPPMTPFQITPAETAIASVNEVSSISPIG